MNRIKLSLAQKVVTLFFLLCMAFTTIVALQYHKGKTGEVFSTLLPLYGTHLSIILAFYFTSKPEVNCYINPFKFLLASVLLISGDNFCQKTLLIGSLVIKKLLQIMV